MTTVTDIRYAFSGVFLEACDCQVLCPCWVGQPPDQDVCNGVFAWDVQTGTLGGETLEPFRVVSVSHHAGNRADARQQVAVFVDYPGASDARLEQLVRIFAGIGGGPLEDIGVLFGTLINDPVRGDADALVRRTIRLDVDEAAGTFELHVGHGNHPALVETSGTVVKGQRDQPITLTESSLSRALGTTDPVTVARSDRFVLFAPNFADSFWLDLDIRGRSATYGRFSY